MNNRLLRAFVLAMILCWTISPRTLIADELLSESVELEKVQEGAITLMAEGVMFPCSVREKNMCLYCELARRNPGNEFYRSRCDFSFDFWLNACWDGYFPSCLGPIGPPANGTQNSR